jgi:hypothetical protein
LVLQFYDRRKQQQANQQDGKNAFVFSETEHVESK